MLKGQSTEPVARSAALRLPRHPFRTLLPSPGGATAACARMSDVPGRADHAAFPVWAREGVLFNLDLAQTVFALLPLQSDGLKRVCRTWYAWLTDMDKRPGLRPAGLEYSIMGNYQLCGSTPDGSLLLVSERARYSFLDYTMRVVSDSFFRFSTGSIIHTSPIAVGEDKIVFCDIRCGLTSVSLSGTDEVRRYASAVDEKEFKSLTRPALSTCGMLFCAVSFEHPYTDDVAVFNSNTLELLYLFEAEGLGDIQGLAVLDKELYVSDCQNCAVKVFSFSGKLLRSVSDVSWRPGQLLPYRDRLYMIERYYLEWWMVPNLPVAYGRRVFVLSTACDVLETHVLESDETYVFDVDDMVIAEMAVLHGKLVLCMDDGGRRALRGL